MGGLQFIEAVGPRACHELVLSLPAHAGNSTEEGETSMRRLGCFYGHEQQTYTIMIEDHHGRGECLNSRCRHPEAGIAPRVAGPGPALQVSCAFYAVVDSIDLQRK